MKILGLKLGSVAIAAVAVYATGALIYGVLFSSQWMAWSGHTMAEMEPYAGRMAFSPVMPILITLGIGLLIRDRGITNWLPGLKLGALIGLLIMVPARMYNWVYGTELVELLALDSVHLLLNAAIAGAVLGGLKAAE